MANISTIRHDSIFNPAKALPVTIIGCGATGSRVFAALVELGVEDLTLIDPDVVEPHNLANQIFNCEDIGFSKVAACVRWCTRKTGVTSSQIMAIQERAPDRFVDNPVVFLLTDTMSSRREIFDAVLKNAPEISQVIETRMASSYGNVFNFNPFMPAESAAWTATLIDDADAEVSSCGTSISVGATASIIANLAVWRYIQFCMAEGHPSALAQRLNLYLDPLVVLREENLCHG